jgi:hydrogenase maturation protein HypF
MLIRREIEVQGIVQGVGFRPFVYRLAGDCGLAGLVANTSAGVSIEVEGLPEAVASFLRRLPAEAPPLAQITRFSVRELAACEARGFEIHPSRSNEPARALVSPDIATCPDCLRELFDPRDRRYLYPFINCTNCGPRFTIIQDIPYDRPRTSMAPFSMCSACQREYDAPRDRRFHAQPNACWNCGPSLQLWTSRGDPIATPDPLAEAVRHLAAGAIVAVKGLGGFHLAVDAANEEAVARLRRLKRRVEKPFAVMVASAEIARVFCECGADSFALLESPRRPIVLLPKRRPHPIAEAVAPGHRDLGIFVAYTPLHHLLFAAGSFSALVMTSGNLSEEPIAIANLEAVQRLGGLADFFLVHDREILRRCDDSVVRITSGRLRQLRRSRGYVPVPIFLNQELPPVLAVGGELKNTVCLAQGRQAFLSQHIGDLENPEAFRFFEEAAEHLERVLEITPQIVACDLHPDYFSTRWALRKKPLECIPVQHHHAHIAACMAENQLDGRVLGIALDGAGYGTDGHIWGGELLAAGYESFERLAHLDEVRMPGGAAAIHEPWRMAVSYLAAHFGRAFLDFPIPFVRALDRRQTNVLLRMIERGVNSPLTSSCGRLFDAVAALAGLRHRVNYEAQAAIELEMALGQGECEPAYPFTILQQGTPWVIGTRGLFEAIVKDLQDGVSIAIISRRFHNGLVEAFVRAVLLARQRTGLDRVCLSGGSLQNTVLLERFEARLAGHGLRVFSHSQVPSNDGGLSLGQALVAAHQWRQRAR